MVIMGAGRGVRLSRVTLVGRRRRVDMVLPSDEPVGRFLPDVLELLGDQPEDPPVSRHLVTAAGTVLPQDGSLASAGVNDGAVLRLVRAQYAPAAPVVHDVTDEVADDLGLRSWTWSPLARRWTAAALSVLLALTAAALAWRSAGPAAVGPWTAGGAVLAVVAGSAATRLGNRGAGNKGLGAALLAIAGALGLLAVAAFSGAPGWSADATWAALGAVAVLALALLGALTPVGRGGLIGAGALLAAGVVWEFAAAVVRGGTPAVQESRIGAVVSVASLVALGLLPRFALLTAGLTSLDDRRAGGVSVGRYQVETALAAAHRGLAMATVVTAGSVAAAGWLTAETSGWWSADLAEAGGVAVLFPLLVGIFGLYARLLGAF